MYQVFMRRPGQKQFEHCEYVRSKQELTTVITDYRSAYPEVEFKFKEFPKKYHPTEPVTLSEQIMSVRPLRMDAAQRRPSMYHVAVAA